MSKVTREVWHCDVCDWEWLPDSSKVPDRCPNRKCRKRNWNAGVAQTAGPDWDGKGFKPGQGPESGIPILLKGEKLKRKTPEGACADVHTETVAEWIAPHNTLGTADALFARPQSDVV